MRKLLSLITLSILTLAADCHAGYSIYTAPMIPEFNHCNGPYGPELCLNSGAVVLPPTYGAEICRPANYSPFVVDPARRTRVFADSAGIAADAEVLAACPGLRAKILTDIQEIRAQALEKATKNSGVAAIYEENYQAAVAVDAGAGDITEMKDGKTATQYMSGFGARLGMTAAQFAAYIIAENKRVGPTLYLVENEYLRLAYSVIPAETSVAKLLTYPDDYRRFCGL